MWKRDGYMLPDYFKSMGYDYAKLEELHAICVAMGVDPVILGSYLTNRVEGETLSDLSMPESLRAEIIKELEDNEIEANYGTSTTSYDTFTDKQLLQEVIEGECDVDNPEEWSPLFQQVKEWQSRQSIVKALGEEYETEAVQRCACSIDSSNGVVCPHQAKSD